MEPSSEFAAWLSERGVLLRGVAAASAGTVGGRGVVVSEHVAAGDVVVEVPDDAVLTAEADDAVSRAALERSGLVDEDSPRLAAEALVVAAAAELGAGADSAWAAYLGSLHAPRSLPLLWDDAERAELLAGTATLDRELAPETDAVDLPTLVSEHWAAVAGPLADEYLGLRIDEELHRKATALVACNAFTLGDGIQALVPFFDVLNHVSPARKSVRLNHDPCKGVLQMVAIKDMAPGEECLNSYGPLGNAELLRRYGFVEPENPHDSALVRAGDVVSGAAVATGRLAKGELRRRLATLAERGLLVEGESTFPVGRDGRPSLSLLESVRILVLEPEDFLIECKRTIVPDEPLALRPSQAKQQEKRVLEALAEVATLSLARYPTTLDADEGRLEKLGGPGGLIEGAPMLKERLALTVRVGEKRCLRALESWLSSGERRTDEVLPRLVAGFDRKRKREELEDDSESDSES